MLELNHFRIIHFQTQDWSCLRTQMINMVDQQEQVCTKTLNFYSMVNFQG